MTLLLALLLAPLIILTLCFDVELLVGLPRLRETPLHSVPMTNVVIVVPAHNEEAMIASTLTELRQAAGNMTRILVVADNCTDRTAAEARAAGAEVIERHDVERRGKGFALDFARQYLSSAPPEIVVIVDADCRLDRQSLERLISTCAQSARPCQAVYLLDPALGAPPTVQISNFAFYVRNVIRQRSLQRLIGRVHLLGTGMALPWRAFDRGATATDDIVEDLRMGIELAEAGSPPLFVEGAEVWSSPETVGNTLVQRRRWEGGFLSHAFGSGPKMLMKGIGQGDVRGLWAALDLMVPPLALLILLDTAALALGAAVVWLLAASSWPLWLLLAAMIVASILVGTVWATGGRQFVAAGSLARIPLYILWKLPLYLGLAKRGPPKEWLRTRGGKA